MDAGKIAQIGEAYFQRLNNIKPKLERIILADYLGPFGDGVDTKELVRSHVEGRSRFFINAVLQWINAFRPLEDLDFLEIGPGTGSMTVPLSMVARSVSSYDISDRSANVARFRCAEMGVGDAKIVTANPDDLLRKISEDHQSRKASAVLMFAVLEHMKIEERLNSLRTCWDALADGGILIIGDTPNRLVYRHGHTSRYPFFDMTPDALMLKYADEFPNPGFVSSIKTWKEKNVPPNEIENRIDRWGRGVSFHEFEIALGSLGDKVIADGFERQMKSIPLKLEERLLMAYLNSSLPHIPLGFARSALYLILQKGGPSGVGKQWNEEATRKALSEWEAIPLDIMASRG